MEGPDRRGGGGDRISVVLATFNGLPYLAEQLLSILHQTRLPDEIVVVDDGSDDASVETVQRVLGDSANVRLSTNSNRLGPAANFGEAIRMSTGTIIVLCDQDDRWQPDKLARLEAALVCTDALAAFSDGRLIDGAGSLLGSSLWEAAGFTRRRRYRWNRGDQVGVLLQSNVVTGATLAFRSSLRDIVLPIPATAWHDHWIALLASISGRIIALPDLLISYRLHERNVMGLPPNELREKALAGLGANAPGAAEIDRLHDLRDRVIEYAPDHPALAQIAKKVRLLNLRSRLPAMRRARLCPVVAEAASGRYHRYAFGLKSIAVDLLRRPPAAEIRPNDPRSLRSTSAEPDDVAEGAADDPGVE